jgi:putative iron-regulated protein
MKLKVMFNLRLRPSLALSLFGAVACSGDPGGGAPIPADPLPVAEEASLTYADIVLASYEDSLAAAIDLDGTLGTLVDDSTDESLDAARAAWIAAREPYLQTEVYRFYGGPIDEPGDGPEGFINAWPLDENYIDYTEDDPTAGIINDTSQEITRDTLTGLNEDGGERNISTGYHAIEFLLWGQDLSVDGPGDRPATDYATDGSGTAENQDRRAIYLRTASELLLDHLDGLVTDWARDDETNYRSRFLTAGAMESLRRMLTGVRLLAGNETGGERLEAALVTGEQEDEHSCFSDNTHRDMIQDIQGIVNVWEGDYVRTNGRLVTGTGIEDVMYAEDAELATELNQSLQECLDLANALHQPFDREISFDNPEGRERVRALVTELQHFASLVDEAFREFHLEIPAPP